MQLPDLSGAVNVPRLPATHGAQGRYNGSLTSSSEPCSGIRISVPDSRTEMHAIQFSRRVAMHAIHHLKRYVSCRLQSHGPYRPPYRAGYD